LLAVCHPINAANGWRCPSIAWLLGTALKLVLGAKVLAYFGPLDALIFLSIILRLIVVFVFRIACLVIWMAKKMFDRASSGAGRTFMARWLDLLIVFACG
jgi:hypothetical protein